MLFVLLDASLLQKGENQAPICVTFHRLPSKKGEKALFDARVDKISRKGWRPVFGQDSRLCSTHFKSNDVEEDKYERHKK